MHKSTITHLYNTDQYKNRKCTKCEKSKPLNTDYFRRDKSNNQGFTTICKECRALYEKEYRKNNKEKVRAKNRLYVNNNRDKHNTHNKNSYNRCRQKVLDKQKTYYNDNKDKIKKRAQQPAKYSTYAHKISYAETIRKEPYTKNNLQTKCTYCGKWFNPTQAQVKARIYAVEKNNGGSRLYCNINCKQACPIFKKIKYPEGFKKSTSREVPAILRQLVLKRDNYKCQKCGATTEDISLHCHHIIPATQNPITAADPDVCTTLCKVCHEKVHSKDGCKYHQLQCKEK